MRIYVQINLYIFLHILLLDTPAPNIEILLKYYQYVLHLILRDEYDVHDDFKSCTVRNQKPRSEQSIIYNQLFWSVRVPPSITN